MQLGKADLAVKCYKKALEINPELHRVRLELSAALMAQRRFDEAKKEAGRVLEIGPPDTVPRPTLKRCWPRWKSATARPTTTSGSGWATSGTTM